MKTIFKKPNSLTDTVFHYCPGCSHGIVHRLVCEVIDELDISGKTIAVEPVGCAVTAHNYFDFDVVQAAHGFQDKLRRHRLTDVIRKYKVIP